MPNYRQFTDLEAKRLEMLYARAEHDILKQIQIYVRSGRAPGNTRNLRRLLLNVQHIRRGLLKGAKTWIDADIPKVYKAGVDWADSDIPKDSPVLPGFFQVHQQAMFQLSQEIYGRLNEVDLTIDGSVRTVARRIDDIYRQAQLEATRGTIAGYKTSQQATRQLQADLKAKGVTGFIDRAGREWSLKNYAKMAAITVTNNTFREGTKNHIQERGYDLVKISNHANACGHCGPYQGRTFSISGQDSEYPPLDEAESGGLFHVRCKHTMSLAPVEKERFFERLNNSETRDTEIARLLAAAEEE